MKWIYNEIINQKEVKSLIIKFDNYTDEFINDLIEIINTDNSIISIDFCENKICIQFNVSYVIKNIFFIIYRLFYYYFFQSRNSCNNNESNHNQHKFREIKFNIYGNFYEFIHKIILSNLNCYYRLNYDIYQNQDETITKINDLILKNQNIITLNTNFKLATYYKPIKDKVAKNVN